MKTITVFHRLAAATAAVAATLTMFAGLASLANHYYVRAATPEAFVTAEGRCDTQVAPSVKKSRGRRQGQIGIDPQTEPEDLAASQHR